MHFLRIYLLFQNREISQESTKFGTILPSRTGEKPVEIKRNGFTITKCRFCHVICSHFFWVGFVQFYLISCEEHITDQFIWVQCQGGHQQCHSGKQTVILKYLTIASEHKK